LAHRRSQCPASDCTAADPRQNNVRIPELIKAGITGPAHRCAEIFPEHAQEMAAHENPRTTKLNDRTKEQLTQDEVERIRL
jgi:hypothetical protein